jgi:hypothetical protein
MQNLFARNRREIADGTASTCLRVTLNQNVDGYESARDLVDLEEVIVSVSAGKLTDAARQQRELVESIEGPGDLWSHADLRQQLLESGNAFGDLRRRRLEIPDFRFSLIGNFWTRAFGGVYVLQNGADKIIIVEDEKQLLSISPKRGERYKAFSVSQKRRILDHLVDEGLIGIDTKYYAVHTKDLEELKYFIEADCVCRNDPKCDFQSLSSARRRGILLGNKRVPPSPLPELKEFCRALEKKAVPDSMGSNLQSLLLRPSEVVGDNAQTILWRLLLRLQDDPVDIMKLYEYDKERFFALFETWPDAKKRWAVQYIKPRYKRKMDG